MSYALHINSMQQDHGTAIWVVKGSMFINYEHNKQINDFLIIKVQKLKKFTHENSLRDSEIINQDEE